VHRRKDVNVSRYKTLRSWSVFLIVTGAVSMVSGSLGVLSWAVAVEGYWDTLGVILLGGPLALMLAAWPLALGQALRAVADIGDSFALDPLLVAPGDLQP
jgi:hypothetical protein